MIFLIFTAVSMQLKKRASGLSSCTKKTFGTEEGEDSFYGDLIESIETNYNTPVSKFYMEVSKIPLLFKRFRFCKRDTVAKMLLKMDMIQKGMVSDQELREIAAMHTKFKITWVELRVFLETFVSSSSQGLAGFGGYEIRGEDRSCSSENTDGNYSKSHRIQSKWWNSCEEKDNVTKQQIEVDFCEAEFLKKAREKCPYAKTSERKASPSRSSMQCSSHMSEPSFSGFVSCLPEQIFQQPTKHNDTLSVERTVGSSRPQ